MKILFINDHGIYPELISVLKAEGYGLTLDHLMRKAINIIKRKKPDIIIAEFAHESQFRDRESNLESMLAQVERNAGSSKTLVFYDPAKRDYLRRVQNIFSIDMCLEKPLTAEQLTSAIERLRGN